jgi:ribosomal protein S13
MQVKISNAAIMLLAFGLPVSAASAQNTSEEVVELRQMIIEMRDNYEQRISDLEARLDNAERVASSARREAGEAIELAEETAKYLQSGNRRSAECALRGRRTRLGGDPGIPACR